MTTPPVLHRALSDDVRRDRRRPATPRDDRFEVVLDQTAFYPTSGGQPFDTGTLGDARRARRHRSRRRRRSSTSSIAQLAVGARVTARSTGAAGSITCSSTPASTCCRPRSIGCSAHADRELSSRRRCRRRSISAARCRAQRFAVAEDEANRDRLGGPSGRHPGCVGRRSACAAAAQGVVRDWPAAAHRDRGLRSVGVRRHARGAHRRHRHHRHRRRGRSSAAARASSSCAAAARWHDFREWRDALAARPSTSRCSRRNWRRPSSGCSRNARRCRRRSARSRSSSPRHEAQRLVAAQSVSAIGSCCSSKRSTAGMRPD